MKLDRVLPRKVPVKGGWYAVKIVPRENPYLLDCIGRCVDELQTIFILKTLTLEWKWATLFHEWTHAIAYGNTDLNIASADSEDAVEHISSQLLLLFKHLDRG